MATSMERPQWKYAAFISFRGVDTRDNFTSHLRTTLRDRGINVFIDNELNRGAKITPTLFKAIRESLSAVIIFSKNYASSSFCLDELVYILKCKRAYNQTVIPVFYGVDPSDLEKLTGEFGDEFYKLKRRVKDELYKSELWRVGSSDSPNTSSQESSTTRRLQHKERVRSWRDTLKEASELAGWDSSVIRDEAELIGKIVREISCKLCSASQSTYKDLVGMDYRVKAVKDKLRVDSDETIITVGICGIGGLGKTTIAKVVYDTIRWKFEVSRFLANVRENFMKHGPCFLQGQLISETAEAVKLWTPDSGAAEIKNRLQGKRVLLVLDDVDCLKQLEMLADDPDWFGPGSRIIITSRDQHLLNACGVNELYKPDPLTTNEAFTLFCLKAFKQTQPEEGYLMLSNLAVEYAKGLPLALTMLGSFLRGRDLVIWEKALRRLNDIPNKEIMDVLQLSYDGLNEEEKEIFLDIVCFFKGMNKDQVVRILDSFGFHSEIGIQVLTDKSLITVSSNKLWMHDLVQMMGWEIVCQESYKDPGRRSRLWKYKDVCDIMINNKQSEVVEGILLDFPVTGEQWNENAFSNMISLRLLIIRNGHYARRPITLPNTLQFLEWHGYPSTSLPTCFQPYKLVHLDLSYSNIKEVWHENKSLMTLKIINLSYCRTLIKTPDFTGTPNLQRLNLTGCVMLSEVHRSIGFLKKLVYINMAGCFKLNKFPEIVEQMEYLQELHLDETCIEELSHSIQLLSGLHLLSLKGCTHLLGLPRSICSLTSLKMLDLSGCCRIAGNPDYLAQMEILEHMDNSGTAIRRPSFWLACRKEVDGKTLSLPSLLGICSLTLILQKCNQVEWAVITSIACFASLACLHPRLHLPLLPPRKTRSHQKHHSLVTPSKLLFENTKDMR